LIGLIKGVGEMIKEIVSVNADPNRLVSMA